MATQTKTGISAGGLLGLFITVVVGAGVLYGLGQRSVDNPKKDNKDQVVVMTVTFEPPKRLTFVYISVVVNAVLVVNNEKTKTSPWVRSFTVKKGQNITLTAAQEVSSRLTCLVNGTVQEFTDHPGSVVCIY